MDVYTYTLLEADTIRCTQDGQLMYFTCSYATGHVPLISNKLSFLAVQIGKLLEADTITCTQDGQLVYFTCSYATGHVPLNF